MITKKCKWVYDEDENFYTTNCGESFYFECDGPEEHGFKFCMYCGLKINISGIKLNG